MFICWMVMWQNCDKNVAATYFNRSRDFERVTLRNPPSLEAFSDCQDFDLSPNYVGNNSGRSYVITSWNYIVGLLDFTFVEIYLMKRID